MDMRSTSRPPSGLQLARAPKAQLILGREMAELRGEKVAGTIAEASAFASGAARHSERDLARYVARPARCRVERDHAKGLSVLAG